MTAFDPTALRQLEADTASRSFVLSLVDTYLGMLTLRVDRLIGALDASDAEKALDAALSLRVSSIMTGAIELAELTTGLIDDLKHDDLPAARGEAELLPTAAERARTALETYVSDPVQESTDSIR